MSKRNRCTLVVPLLIAIACPLLVGAETGKLITYDNSSGESYFALSLTPPPAPQATQSRDILVLFDTSASQTGAYRDDAINALKSFLANLEDTHRVKLMAVDLDAVDTSAQTAIRKDGLSQEKIAEYENAVVSVKVEAWKE